MIVDLDMLQALENTWAATAADVRALDAQNALEAARGSGLPGSLTEASLRLDVVAAALTVTAEHFERLEAMTRGTRNDYVITESEFVKLVSAAGYR